MFWDIFSGDGTLSIASAEAEWAVAPGIDIEYSVSYDILNILFMALVLSFVVEGRFLSVHASPPCLLGQCDCDVVSVQAPAATKGFWQLEQSETPPARGFPGVKNGSERVLCCT